MQGVGSDVASDHSSEKSFGGAQRSLSADLAGIAAAGIARLRDIASGTVLRSSWDLSACTGMLSVLHASDRVSGQHVSMRASFHNLWCGSRIAQSMPCE